MLSPSVRPLPVSRLVLIGAVLPAAYVALDVWLVEHSKFQLMAALVAQVGLLGVLCGRLIEPPWLRWIIYGWVWVLMDATVFPFTSASDLWRWDSISVLATSLFAAQLGLVTVWTILGTAKWTFRWPAGLLLATVGLVPIIWRDNEQSEPLLLVVVQSATLALLCGLLHWRGFRLILAGPQALPATAPASEGARRQLPGAQFGVRDLLWWTTSLAIVLAIGRALDFVAASLAAFQWFYSFATLADWEMISFAAVLTAMVLVVALWAALGAGSPILRASLLALISVTAGLIYSIPHFRLTTRGSSWPPGDRSFWNPDYRGWFFSFEWANIAWFALAGGLLFASLLIFRTLGYRLCRVVKRASQDDSAGSTA